MSGNGAEVLLRQLSSSLARWCHAKRKKPSLSPTKTVETKSTRKIRFLKSHSIPWNVGTTKKRQPRWSFRLCLSWEQGKQCDFKQKNTWQVLVPEDHSKNSRSQSEESLQLHERSETVIPVKVKCQVTNYESSLGRWWCNA